ncbi:2-keto-4-pentenoate hydratase [Bradyrhizobium centrolobii]|uniref:2-keto-4-pentenoate hydratase n=1 Tax=Bradyrhizobium centrolobii TaxID=1505087 RepID=UPI000AD1A7EF|nr:hydratase [Bradyrhizobium centrolobii]
MDVTRQRELARHLASLRRERRQQSGLAEPLVPPDADTAYRIARMVEEELGWDVIGWKIAGMKAGLQRQLRTNAPIYGRVFAPLIKASPASVEHANQCSPIPEVEYQARLGTDLPPRTKPYTIEEVGDAVASLHPGIELAECRFIHDAAFPPMPAILADGAGSGSIVLGDAIADWRDRDIANQDVLLNCNCTMRRRGTAAAAIDHPIVPLTWLANELSRTGIGLKAGQTISTGTLTGMLRPKAGETTSLISARSEP